MHRPHAMFDMALFGSVIEAMHEAVHWSAASGDSTGNGRETHQIAILHGSKSSPTQHCDKQKRGGLHVILQ